MDIAFSRRVVESTASDLVITKASVCDNNENETIASLNMVYSGALYDVGRKYNKEKIGWTASWRVAKNVTIEEEKNLKGKLSVKGESARVVSLY